MNAVLFNDVDKLLHHNEFLTDLSSPSSCPQIIHTRLNGTRIIAWIYSSSESLIMNDTKTNLIATYTYVVAVELKTYTLYKI